MDFDRAQAEWRLGRFPWRDLPELAAQMMVRGFDGPSIFELACFHRPAPGDVPRELVDRAFAEIGRPPLSPAQAARILAGPIAARIVRRACDPAASAQAILSLLPRLEEENDAAVFRDLEYLLMRLPDDGPPDAAWRAELEALAWRFLEEA